MYWYIHLLALPARFGSLVGISDPVESALCWHLHLLASVLINAIHGATESKVTTHLEQCMPSPVWHTFGRAIDFQTTGRLNVLPLTCNHLDPSSLQFYDTLLLGYHRPLSSMPSHCDGCGSTFDLSQPLDCCKGRLVTQHNNEVRT